MNLNKYRFSSKEWNGNAGLYYYGRRIYAPDLQRWLNRDPIQEKGGLNLYTFDGNDGINKGDPIGDDAFDLVEKLAGLQVPKTIGGTASALVVLGPLTLGGGLNYMFFPDTCQRAFFKMTSTMGVGINAGWGFSAEMALYENDPVRGHASPENYEGPFIALSGGAGAAWLSFGGSLFGSQSPDSAGGSWYGLDLTWSPWLSLPAEISLNEWDYVLVPSSEKNVPLCECYAAILFMP